MLMSSLYAALATISFSFFVSAPALQVSTTPGSCACFPSPDDLDAQIDDIEKTRKLMEYAREKEQGGWQKC